LKNLISRKLTTKTKKKKYKIQKTTKPK